MELFSFIFRLGVLFAIFGFIWWIIQLGYAILRGGARKSVTEFYVIRFIRYVLLVDVTVMFCLDANQTNLSMQETVIAGLILLTYFIGRLQNAQLRTKMFNFQISGNMEVMNRFKPIFDFRSEAMVIGFSILTFIFLIIYPEYASNAISLWFYNSIIDIENTAIFGFIFKVVGFFFVLAIFMKFASGITALLSGTVRQRDNKDDDDYDNYTEVR
ncbi:MAG: hypothetical protein JJT77_04625 [Crocinitomicaceae bacterium]|nr:hypothetical protein [Crocinitomicaceae bacterium]